MSPMTLTEAFEAFEVDELLSEDRSAKTIASYRSTCSTLLEDIGNDIEIAFFSYNHIIQWKRGMHARNNSGAHMALQLRELRRVLNYLKSHGFATLDASEIKIPKFKYRKTAWLTVEEVGQLLGAIENPRDKALFGCLFGSGARISELLSLNRSSIVNGSAEIYGKGKKVGRDDPDTLQFDGNALSLLDDYLVTRKDRLEPLFLSRQNRRLCIQQCIILAHKYAKLAGIEKRVTTHVLRHSFGTNLELNGMDIHGMSQQLRHKKLETTKIYLHGEELNKKPNYDKYHTPVPID